MIEKRSNTRESNLELFRIVSMLLIIMHHYVVNSGVWSVLNQDVLSIKSVFLLIISAYGKIGTNCFLLITGYFMCKSNISLKKFLKLYGEIIFYNLVIGVIFIAVGRETFSVLQLLKRLLPFYSIGGNFVGCFIVFWLCIPFLNILIRNMNKRQHGLLTLLLLIIYSGIASLSFIPGVYVSMNYVSWFTVLYLTASYIRLYSPPTHTAVLRIKAFGV